MRPAPMMRPARTVESCQVGVFLRFITDDEHVLADSQLYLRAEWAKARKCRKRRGVPKGTRYRIRRELALEMTVPQAPAGLALIVRKAYRCHTEARSGRERTRWMERKELEWPYRYKACYPLPLLKN